MYRRVEIAKHSKFHWRLTPVFNNNYRNPQYRSYVTKWNAKRAARKMFPDVEIVVVDKAFEVSDEEKQP